MMGHIVEWYYNGIAEYSYKAGLWRDPDPPVPAGGNEGVYMHLSFGGGDRSVCR